MFRHQRAVGIGGVAVLTCAFACSSSAGNGDAHVGEDGATNGDAHAQDASTGGDATSSGDASTGGDTGTGPSDAGPGPDAAVPCDQSARFTPSAARATMAPGAINGGMLRPHYTALHAVSTPDVPAYCPVEGVASVGTAEYSTGLLMTDGRILMMTASGLVPLPVPAGTTFRAYAGGLHQSVAIDSTGHVWGWGDTTSGLSGTGSNGGDASMPQKILTDVSGADFTDVVYVRGGWTANAAVKSDGSVWVWGNCAAGGTGDGTNGGVVMRPTRVPLPSTAHVTAVMLSDIVLALASDGSVWSWGGVGNYGLMAELGRHSTDGTHPGQVMGLPNNIVQIAAGSGFSYALTADGHLWGWGRNGPNLGLSITANDGMIATPMDLTTALALPAPVRTVVTNDGSTHVILTDGSLWGWGDASFGGVGDGQELDFSALQPDPGGAVWAWDWGVDDLLVPHPVRLVPHVSNFHAIYTNSSAVFYVFAQTEDGYLYSWGRNKTGDLMNGIIPAAPVYGQISADYPNSWDVTVPTLVNPMQLTHTVQSTSPYCELHPTESPCSQYTGM